MSQAILITVLSVLIFGTCSPSSDQEGKLARFRETIVTRQVDQANQARVAAAEQAAREQAYKAHLALLAEELSRCDRRMDELAKNLDARLKSYETKVLSPEEKRRHAQLIKTMREARSAIEASRVSRKRMAER